MNFFLTTKTCIQGAIDRSAKKCMNFKDVVALKIEPREYEEWGSGPVTNSTVTCIHQLIVGISWGGGDSLSMRA